MSIAKFDSGALGGCLCCLMYKTALRHVPKISKFKNMQRKLNITKNIEL